MTSAISKFAIEESAKYGVRWTNWLGVARFDRWNKYQRNDGLIVLAGDEAEAQNGFGNWLRANYSCTFNADTGKVVNVTLEAGKLH